MKYYKKVEFGDERGRWSVLQNQNKDNLIRLQSGTNRFDSQKVIDNISDHLEFFNFNITSAFRMINFL